MQVAVTDWQWSPPALGLALSQYCSSSAWPDAGKAEGSGLGGQVAQECIVPALEASNAGDFLREVGRRLPLFAALHMKLLDEFAEPRRLVADLPTIPEAFAALEDELRVWAHGLDDLARAELEIVISTLNRSNQLLIESAQQDKQPSTGVADLFRTAVLAEFLLSCLWRLVKLGERPPIAAQIIYNLRYAVLDHAAAVRYHLKCPEEPRMRPSSSVMDDESSFWATAGVLPLAELGEGS